MADTGAPWNIPFVEPTDLVRDYPAADEAQALAVAAGLTAAAVGKVLQVVTATDSVDRTTSSSSFVSANLSASLTPSASGNLVIVQHQRTLQTSRTGRRNPGRAKTRVVVGGSAITGFEENGDFYEAGTNADRTLDTSSTNVGIHTTSGTSTLTFEVEFAQVAPDASSTLVNSRSTGVLTLIEVAP